MKRPISNVIFMIQMTCGCLLGSNGLLASESGLVDQAERFFCEKLYMDACLLYEQALSTNQSPEQAPQLSMRLATCYLELCEDQKAFNLLSNLSPSDQIQSERVYLLAMAYRHLGKYQQAIQLIQSSSEKTLAPEIELELGLDYYHLHQPLKATAHLQAISWDPLKSQSYYMAQLYLIRLNMEQSHYDRAQSSIHSLKLVLPLDHPLQPELAYLQGLSFFFREHYIEAASAFEQSLRNNPTKRQPWHAEAFYYQAYSYLKQTGNPRLSREDLITLFSKAEQALKSLLTIYQPLAEIAHLDYAKAPGLNIQSRELSQDPNAQLQLEIGLTQIEKYYLALSEVYIAQGHLLNDETAYLAAQKLLSQNQLFTTSDGKNKALLLQAQAAPTYSERVRFYELITKDKNQESPFYGQAWYLRGLNDYEEGLAIKKEGGDSSQFLEQASNAFAQASVLFESSDLAKAALSLKYQGLANYHQGTPDKMKQAWILLKGLTEQKDRFTNPQDLQETFYLAALVGQDLSDKDSLSLEEVEKLLMRGIEIDSHSLGAEPLLKALAMLYWNHKLFAKSEISWARLIDEHAHSPLCSEAWFWRAKCAENLQNTEKQKQYYQEVFTHYPDSSLAPLAYYNFYSNREYMRGSRKAIKHLQAMSETFPDNPLLITAHYMIGLDYKKDRLSEGGKILHHKDLISAINAFQEAEATFDRLSQQNLIPQDQLFYYTQVRYRANLERALANRSIAEESQGAKKKVYLEYTEEVLKQLQGDFHKPLPHMTPFFAKADYPNLLEETEFQLTLLNMQMKKEDEAEKLFKHMLQHYQAANIKQSYFLSRLWYEKGLWAQKNKKCNQALDYFGKAESAFDNLNPDEKLDLWIQQALCYKELGLLMESMRILSKVVNDEAISGLRVKAMYLRAEIYELQGKPELAMKQLEATSKKGGEWGQKAKEKISR